MSNIFEKATKKKLRFDSSRGLLSVEDLWDLKLTGKVSLDEVARTVHRELKNEEEESFVATARRSSDNSLRMEIVKYIIDVRLKEAETAEKREINRTKREKITSIIEAKKDAELQNMSVEELEAMANSL